ncbi:MAG: ATPase, T2SS/T4P/T4SS family [Terrimicrobiaceae bacterium]|nr:ATPase, T2SS/T4P/T4SS family [Terrimicrobiaceae bacterium]
MLSPLIEGLLRAADESGASDLILHRGKIPQARVNGELIAVDSPPVDADDLDRLWAHCQAPAGATDFDAGLTSATGTRFRVNLLHQLGARAAVLRRIRSQVPEMATLGLPAELLKTWAARRSGIVLVCGPTGSGKSTTVASLLDWINSESARHIVTIEDPVEFVFTPRRATFTQREVGIDTPTFAEGLRRSLRQSPDVIFLGEIRDGESAATALQAAETGHLVFATLHAANSSDMLARLELLFTPEERETLRNTLAGQLIGVLCQRLLPALDGQPALVVEFFTNSGLSRKILASGRASELTDFIARADPKDAQSFATSLLGLIRSGRVVESVAIENADNPQEIQRALRGVASSNTLNRR